MTKTDYRWSSFGCIENLLKETLSHIGGTILFGWGALIPQPDVSILKSILRVAPAAGTKMNLFLNPSVHCPDPTTKHYTMVPQMSAE
jgi:hypothetical protein